MAFLTQTLILVASVSAYEGCFEKDVRYRPQSNFDLQKLLSNVDYGCDHSASCGTRAELDSPEKCQEYCRLLEECEFWTYMSFDSGNECYLQNGLATREQMEEGSGRISGPKCCGECGDIPIQVPGFFDEGGSYEELVKWAADVLEYKVPGISHFSHFTDTIELGALLVGDLISWFQSWFYRRRLQLQSPRFLQSETPRSNEIGSALTGFYDGVEKSVHALEEKAVTEKTRGDLKMVVAETFTIRNNTTYVEDQESVFNALHTLDETLKSDAAKLHEALSSDESLEFKNEVIEVLPFFEKMERFTEYAYSLGNATQGNGKGTAKSSQSRGEGTEKACKEKANAWQDSSELKNKTKLTQPKNRG